MKHFQAIYTGDIANIGPSEITDARESYVEKFKNMLIDKYELTSPSVINAGIAGDMLPSMAKRLERDVLRYQPDLVVINGSLNWSPELGGAQEYKELLANGINHPSVEGHEVYAKVLMQLLD